MTFAGFSCDLEGMVEKVTLKNQGVVVFFLGISHIKTRKDGEILLDHMLLATFCWLVAIDDV